MAQAKAQKVAHADPVKVDSKHYTVEVENEKVRVLRIKYGPHEKAMTPARSPDEPVRRG